MTHEELDLYFTSPTRRAERHLGRAQDPHERSMGLGRAGGGAVEPAERRGSGGIGRRAQHVLLERSRRRRHAPLRRAAADPRHPLGATRARGRPRKPRRWTSRPPWMVRSSISCSPPSAAPRRTFTSSRRCVPTRRPPGRAPAELTALSSTSRDTDPALFAQGRGLIFASLRTAPGGKTDSFKPRAPTSARRSPRASTRSATSTPAPRKRIPGSRRMAATSCSCPTATVAAAYTKPGAERGLRGQIRTRRRPAARLPVEAGEGRRRRAPNQRSCTVYRSASRSASAPKATLTEIVPEQALDLHERS